MLIAGVAHTDPAFGPPALLATGRVPTFVRSGPVETRLPAVLECLIVVVRGVTAYIIEVILTVMKIIEVILIFIEFCLTVIKISLTFIMTIIQFSFTFILSFIEFILTVI